MFGIAVFQRYADKFAVGAVGPAVIAANEFFGMAAVGRDHHGAAMGALIVYQANAAIGVADKYQGTPADPGGDEIARLPDLAFMADIHPGAVEDAFHLHLEDIRISVYPPVDPSRLNEPGDVDGSCSPG